MKENRIYLSTKIVATRWFTSSEGKVLQQLIRRKYVLEHDLIAWANTKAIFPFPPKQFTEKTWKDVPEVSK